MAKHLLIAFTNAVPGRDAAFHDWYDRRHIPDVLQIPGITAARRYRLSEVQRSQQAFPYAYMAIYEIETDDLSAVRAHLAERSGTPRMPLDDSMEQKRESWFFTLLPAQEGP